jgi:hypothetical protein
MTGSFLQNDTIIGHLDLIPKASPLNTLSEQSCTNHLNRCLGKVLRISCPNDSFIPNIYILLMKRTTNWNLCKTFTSFTTEKYEYQYCSIPKG